MKLLSPQYKKIFNEFVKMIDSNYIYNCNEYKKLNDKLKEMCEKDNLHFLLDIDFDPINFISTITGILIFTKCTLEEFNNNKYTLIFKYNKPKTS